MQSPLAAILLRTITTLLFTIAFAISLAASVSAQVQRSERELAARERELRGIGKVTRIENDIGPSRVTLGQIREDYKGIQAANNNILNMLSLGDRLDYKVIEDAASEIKKRAGRLKSYLIILQLTKENEKRQKNLAEIETQEIKASLLSLDASIVRLINNSIFKNFNKVVDADGSIKARDDLDDIIELSDGIKRSAKRAMKLARASR